MILSTVYTMSVWSFYPQYNGSIKCKKMIHSIDKCGLKFISCILIFKHAHLLMHRTNPEKLMAIKVVWLVTAAVSMHFSWNNEWFLMLFYFAFNFADGRMLKPCVLKRYQCWKKIQVTLYCDASDLNIRNEGILFKKKNALWLIMSNI